MSGRQSRQEGGNGPTYFSFNHAQLAVSATLEIADNDVDYRLVAAEAVAFTNDGRAKSKSSEVASCFDGNKQGCLRTIAPLSNLKDLPAPNMRRQNGGNSDE